MKFTFMKQLVRLHFSTGIQTFDTNETNKTTTKTEKSKITFVQLRKMAKENFYDNQFPTSSLPYFHNFITYGFHDSLIKNEY